HPLTHPSSDDGIRCKLGGNDVGRIGGSRSGFRCNQFCTSSGSKNVTLIPNWRGFSDIVKTLVHRSFIVEHRVSASCRRTVLYVTRCFVLREDKGPADGWHRHCCKICHRRAIPIVTFVDVVEK
ncbi:unnamed protein product, partial [Ectocarpus sp. 4 AP-2014]